MTAALDVGVHVRDPRTGRDSGTLNAPTRGELTQVASRLRSSQPGWSVRSPQERAEVLRRFAARIHDNPSGLVQALVADTGRLSESHLEVQVIEGMLQRWAALGPQLLAQPTAQASSFPWIEVMGGTRPYPLVGAITPWNFPLLLGLIDAIPALAAGCAVIVKPSEVTPRFVEPLMSLIAADGELADVFHVVVGAAETGQALIEEVDAIAFTGSVPTGRVVAAQAAARFIPAFLELGGKDPAIVLSGADPEHAAHAILWGGTANAGQSCLSIERVYVDRSLYDDFVRRLVTAAQQVSLAWPTPGDGQIGPIIAADQIEVIERHLTDAINKGARALCGGSIEWLDGGAYVRPTVLVDVDHTMLVMREETFGPLLPVMAVDGREEAIRLANDSDYGLSAAVFGGTAADALEVAARLDAGAVSVNDAALTALVHDGEKNSFNSSGLGGSRMGPAALTRFLRKQAFIVNREGRRDPWWHNGGDAKDLRPDP